MSDAEARWARDVDIIMAHAAHSDRVAGYALAAVDEAQAILAEMEPPTCGSYQRLTWLGDWSADVAGLLRAFVEA